MTIPLASRIPPRSSACLRPAAAAALLPLLASACATGAAAPVRGPLTPSLELQALPPYAVYTAEGEPATLDDVVAAMEGVDVVFVGEEHDDPVGHRVEAELLERAFRRYGARGEGSPHDAPAAATRSGEPRTVVLSLEMFERDVQLVLDEYVTGLISEEHLLASARPWPRYATDYKPMVEFARAHGLPVVAANVPRRYVNMVSRGGREALEGLSEEARAWLPPLPYPQPSDLYRSQWDSVMAEAMRGAGGQGRHAATPPESVLQAQALWDAGMAWSVAEALEELSARRPLVLHYVGGFHVERGTGTPEALEHYAPGADYLVVAMRAVEDPRVFAASDRGRGEFVVLTRDGGG